MYVNIVQTPPPSFFFLREGANFKYLPQGSEKLRKGGESMVQGQVFLKGGAGTFPINLFQGLSFLHSQIIYPLQNCVMHLKKNYFFLPP